MAMMLIVAHSYQLVWRYLAPMWTISQPTRSGNVSRHSSRFSNGGSQIWRPLASGGWHFRHSEVGLLVNNDINRELPELFNGNGNYAIKEYRPPVVAFCYAPKRVSNNTLVNEIPGLFKANYDKRAKQKKNKKNLILRRCLFYNERARARALRESATVNRFVVEFRLPFRRACHNCYSYDHLSQDCHSESTICRKCSSEGHL